VNLRLSDELTAFTLLRGMVVFDIKLGMMSTQPPDIIFAEAPDLRTLPLLSLPFKLRSLYLYITVLSGKAVKLKDAPVH
jgi:hypothetical protein